MKCRISRGAEDVSVTARDMCANARVRLYVYFSRLYVRAGSNRCDGYEASECDARPGPSAELTRPCQYGDAGTVAIPYACAYARARD